MLLFNKQHKVFLHTEYIVALIQPCLSAMHNSKRVDMPLKIKYTAVLGTFTYDGTLPLFMLEDEFCFFVVSLNSGNKVQDILKYLIESQFYLSLLQNIQNDQLELINSNGIRINSTATFVTCQSLRYLY